jgi:hypothetical protein
MQHDSDKPWPSCILLKTDKGLRKYTPKNDFHMCIGDFPHLLVEVTSDTRYETDRRRMLLQASYLVRLGNSLRIQQSSDSIVIMAIYINKRCRALQYLLHQPDVTQPTVLRLNYLLCLWLMRRVSRFYMSRRNSI